jgi:hypothetical protein
MARREVRTAGAEGVAEGDIAQTASAVITKGIRRASISNKRRSHRGRAGFASRESQPGRSRTHDEPLQRLFWFDGEDIHRPDPRRPWPLPKVCDELFRNTPHIINQAHMGGVYAGGRMCGGPSLGGVAGV